MFNNTILQCTFEMHPDIIQQERSVYSVWDMFGDVGGLFDMLSYIGQGLVGLISLVSGSPLNRFIFARLFMLEGKASKYSRDILKAMKKRRPASFGTCEWLL